MLRDAGFEVIYTGIRRTPEELVSAAMQNGVQAIGISLLSGAHLSLMTRVMELLNDRQAGSIPVFVGGIIPEGDVSCLQAMGVRAVFGPGSSDRRILEAFRNVLAEPYHRHEPLPRVDPSVMAISEKSLLPASLFVQMHDFDAASTQVTTRSPSVSENSSEQLCGLFDAA